MSQPAIAVSLDAARNVANTPHTTLHNKHYLVFSGGGIHGISHLGFLSFVKCLLGPEQFRAQFRGFAGASIGAFLSMLLVCGELNLSRLFYWMANPAFFAKILQSFDLHRTFKSFGAVPNTVGLTYVGSILDFYFPGASRWTFRQLYEKTKKELVVVTVNVSTGEAEYHSHKTKPDFVVASSVYASMCVPLVCQPMKINGSFYFDGGILDNFPFVHSGFPVDQCLGSYLQSDMAIHSYLSAPPTLKSWSHFILELIYMMCRPTSNVYFPKQAAFQNNIVMIPQSKSTHYLKIWASSHELYRLYLRGIYYTRRHFQLDFLRSLFGVFL